MWVLASAIFLSLSHHSFPSSSSDMITIGWHTILHFCVIRLDPNWLNICLRLIYLVQAKIFLSFNSSQLIFIFRRTNLSQTCGEPIQQDLWLRPTWQDLRLYVTYLSKLMLILFILWLKSNGPNQVFYLHRLNWVFNLNQFGLTFLSVVRRIKLSEMSNFLYFFRVFEILLFY